ncbi:MAG: PilZ domain-containing protein [Pseudomonadota bacterium]
MDQLILREASNPVYFRERRKNDRCSELNLLVITNRGTGKIMDISRDGLSFGCLYPHNFPVTLLIDILDAKGLHLKQLTVRKVWERNSGDPELSGRFELEIGVEFLDLTPHQENSLDILLSNLIFADIQTP